MVNIPRRRRGECSGTNRKTFSYGIASRRRNEQLVCLPVSRSRSSAAVSEHRSVRNPNSYLGGGESYVFVGGRGRVTPHANVNQNITRRPSARNLISRLNALVERSSKFVYFRPTFIELPPRRYRVSAGTRGRRTRMSYTAAAAVISPTIRVC